MERDDGKPSEIEVKQAIDGQSVDWYLQSLVQLVNNTRIRMEIGITLIVGGSVISGLLIGGKTYFEAFAKDFSSAFPSDDETKEFLRESFAKHGTIYDEPDSGEEKSKTKRHPPQYIHLKNARIWSASGAVPARQGVLWRGKINAVSGFSLGLLS